MKTLGINKWWIAGSILMGIAAFCYEKSGQHIERQILTGPIIHEPHKSDL